MLSNTLIFVIGGCALGALQLAAGIVIGIWLRRPNSTDAHNHRHDMLQASTIAKRLQSLADEMSASAQEHRSQLDRASQMLVSENEENDESLSDLVADVIGDIVRANQNLQSKLDTAETRLAEQATEIEAHISRSLTDPLTGLPNRREFNERLEERMGAWNRRHEVFSLLMLDVDHFKKLNDQHGHLAGDQVLAAIGRALRGAVRREDAVARYGGEEFAVLLPSTSLEQAVLVTQKVREEVARVVINHNQQKIAVTVSGGLAAISPNEPSDTLIQRADAALYAAKAAGRNRAFVHNGIDCHPADDFQSQPDSASPAARLVQLINSPDAHKTSAEESGEVLDTDFGDYLPREVISAELAQTCQELRRCVEDRSFGSTDPATAPRSDEAAAKPAHAPK